MDLCLNPIPVLATDADCNVRMHNSPFDGWKLTITDPIEPRPQILLVEGGWENALAFMTNAGFTYDQHGPEPLEVRLRTTHKRQVADGFEVATCTPVNKGDAL